MKIWAALFLFPVALGASELREFTVSALRCQALTCDAREGIMPHRLTTVEACGTAKQWAGYSLLLRVVKSEGALRRTGTEGGRYG